MVVTTIGATGHGTSRASTLARIGVLHGGSYAFVFAARVRARAVSSWLSSIVAHDSRAGHGIRRALAGVFVHVLIRAILGLAVGRANSGNLFFSIRAPRRFTLASLGIELVVSVWACFSCCV